MMIATLNDLLAPLNIDYEIIHSSNLNRSYQFENNILKTIAVNETSGIGLRIIKEGRIGFAATTNLGDLQRLIDQALVSARFGKRARFEFPAHCRRLETPVYDSAVESLSDEIALENCNTIIEHLTALDPALKINTQTNAGIATTTLLNSNGLELSSLDSGFSLFADGLKVDNHGMLMLAHGISSAKYHDSVDEIVAEISDLYTKSQKIIKAKTEKIAVIFTPRSLRMLIRMIIQALNGKAVQKGISPLGEKLGSEIISPLISIIDDPTIPYAYGSCQFDMEGSEVTKKHLVENGILKTHLYDLQTAGACQTQATGNASRGFSSQPGIDISNLVVAAGSMSSDEIYRHFPRALVVESVLGEGQGNSLAGEFSVNIGLGFLVENGEVIGRVKDGMLAGNIYEFGNRVVGLSRERRLNGATHLPHMLVDALSLSGKA